MNINFNYLSKSTALAIEKALVGKWPTENRIVIVSPKGETTTKSGLFIPDASKEDLPRRGVIVQIGHISEDNYSYTDLDVGDIVTYGMYAGKEIEIPSLEDMNLLNSSEQTLSVLSLTEIIYVEKQL